jgi:hypothetical protein
MISTATARATIGVHVELPATAAATHREVSVFQAHRALNRPVLASEGFPAYALCDATIHGSMLRLDTRPESEWSDGRPVTAREICDGIRRGFATRRGLAALLGVDPWAIESREDGTIEITSRNHAADVARVLRNPGFTPERDDRLGTGAFHNVSADTLTLYSRRNDRALQLWDSTAAVDVIREFRRGKIALTSPTAFDVAARCAGHRDFRPCEPDVTALLLVHPDRGRPLAGVASRVAIARALRFPDALAHVVIPSDVPAGLDDDGGTSAPRRTVSVLYTDYFPNAALVRALVGAARGIADLRPQPVDLAGLRARVDGADFDAALVLLPGMFEPGMSGSVVLASLAMIAGDAATRDEVLSAFDAGSSRLARAVWECVPAITIGRFASGYLASPEVEPMSVVYGTVHPVEVFA